MRTSPRCSATPPSSRRPRASTSRSRSSTATATSRMRFTSASRPARPTSSCPGRCCSGSTWARASCSRWTTSSPGPPASGMQAISSPRSWMRTAGPGASATRSGRARCWRSPSTASRTTSRTCPRTWSGTGSRCRRRGTRYFATAEELVRKSAGAVHGFGQRGKEAWHTMYTGYASQIWSCGGRDFGDDLRCAIASPEVVAPTEAFIAALRAAGPPSWTDQRWYELALDFGAGRLRPDRRLRPLRRDLRGPGALAAGRADRLRPAAGRPGRCGAAESLDLVARDERELARQEPRPGSSSSGHRAPASCCARSSTAT